MTDADGKVYEIVPTQSMASVFEYTIQATGEVGTAATEIIVVGQTSFVSACSPSGSTCCT